MSKNEQKIEQEIQEKGLNAPRLTPEYIDSVIVGESYTNLPDGRTIICQLTLKNGFTIDGKSACVSKDNFNQEIGNKIARQNAREKIWELEGYLLKEKLYQDSLKPKSQATTICTEERLCTPCYANDGTCEVNEAFMKELTDLSYKYGVTVGVTQESGDTIALFPMLEEDKRLGASYTEVITGSGFIEFG